MQEYIELKGARENNLKDVNLRLPKRKITIFTGVSGSGKSSIVFETIATEASRQLNENFSAFIRGFLPKYGQPDCDSIENLSTAIVVDQKHIGGNSRSTLGTITDINPYLRVLFSKVGLPTLPHVNYFSFNFPEGMCPDCHGIGRKVGLDLNAAIDKTKSLNEGAILLPSFNPGSYFWNLFAISSFFDLDKKLSDFTKEEWHNLIYRENTKVLMDMGGTSMNATYESLTKRFDRMYVKKEGDISESTQKRVSKFMTNVPCDCCHGTRFNPQTLECKVGGYNIAEMTALQIDELIQVLQEIDDSSIASLVKSCMERLQALVNIGLDYLSLDRETSTLSGGESQRIKMVKHLNSSLTDLMYILDEPSVGLHPRDVHRLNELLMKLRDKGNTVIVVEHDPDVIKIADHIVDVGPYAGTNGGEIVYEGSYEGLLESDTLSGRFLKFQTSIKNQFRTATDYYEIEKCSANNLKNVSVKIPKGVMTALTGVAGSGKSTLIREGFLPNYPEAIVIDQSAVGANVRSNPATYSGVLDIIRKMFAKENNVNPALFSFNSKGACPDCNGHGVIYTELQFMETIKTTCEACGGKRFKEEVLSYKINGKNISDILNMTIAEALEFFEGKKDLKTKLQSMFDVGLTYLKLGQPLSTLSGGECQRLKLANELHKSGSIYVMDEPTTGLHMSDIEHLLTIINRLVDSGNTVIIIEHNLNLVRQADWVIDLGPEGGSKGGEVVFEGTPHDLMNCKCSLTAPFISLI
ncbi:MAG: thiamine transporter permease [Bacillales bacterium]|jgi:excinuclease UvrABC ATPase subunit|nr:thiamine transporter permease [Bacillales bacterium]